MGAPVGKRFRQRGSVGAMRSVYSFFNVSPGVPGKQSIQFLIKEPIIKVPDTPPVPATVKIPVEGFRISPMATQARFLRGPHLGTLGFPKGTGDRVDVTFTVDEGPRAPVSVRPMRAGTPAALTAVTISSGDRPVAGIRSSMKASATRHRRRLRILAGEPGFGGP